MRKQLSKKEFMNNAILAYPNLDTLILNFIADFVYHDDPASTINLFSNGYCYHFAQILQATFQTGEICWVAPYSHIVWVNNNIPYDINGVYNGESKKFIPIEFLGHAIEDFKHNPKIYHISSKNDIDNIIFKYDTFMKNNKGDSK